MENSQLVKLKEQAVEAALRSDFREAIKLNLQILEYERSDIDTLMQLAYAYHQIKNYKEAEKYYKKALRLQPNNVLAQKKLQLLKNPKNSFLKDAKKTNGQKVNISELIEEPGKTKNIKLLQVGKPEVISALVVGEEVYINIRKRKIEIRNSIKQFVGYLPDDISKRLIQFIKAGSEYKAYVFSQDKNEVRIFVRELKKGKKVKNYTSFVSETAGNNLAGQNSNKLPDNIDEEGEDEDKADFDPDSEEAINLVEPLEDHSAEAEDEEDEPDDYHREEFEE